MVAAGMGGVSCVLQDVCLSSAFNKCPCLIKAEVAIRMVHSAPWPSSACLVFVPFIAVAVAAWLQPLLLQSSIKVCVYIVCVRPVHFQAQSPSSSLSSLLQHREADSVFLHVILLGCWDFLLCSSCLLFYVWPDMCPCSVFEDCILNVLSRFFESFCDFSCLVCPIIRLCRWSWLVPCLPGLFSTIESSWTVNYMFLPCL